MLGTSCLRLLPTQVSLYDSRPFLVVHAERFAAGIHEAIADEEVLKLPRCLGSVDQFVDSTDALNHPERFKPVNAPIIGFQ